MYCGFKFHPDIFGSDGKTNLYIHDGICVYKCINMSMCVCVFDAQLIIYQEGEFASAHIWYVDIPN